MKSEFCKKRSQSNQLRRGWNKLISKTISWSHILCFILFVPLWNSCEIVSTDEVDTNVGVYMWSSIFESVENQSLISFFEDKDIKSVFLSVGFVNPQLEKATEFVLLAHEKDIEVSLLFGGNVIVNHEKNDLLNQLHRLFEIAKKIGTDEVHLNVEPHAFADWDQNRTTYEKNYLNMLKEAEKIFSDGSLSLSVSIPHFYDSINSEIEKYVDQAVVMVYETTNISMIKSRTEKESEIFKEKMSIAIRPEDYSTGKALDQVIIQIMETGAASGVFLHDAGAMMNIENENR